METKSKKAKSGDRSPIVAYRAGRAAELKTMMQKLAEAASLLDHMAKDEEVVMNHVSHDALIQAAGTLDDALAEVAKEFIRFSFPSPPNRPW